MIRKIVQSVICICLSPLLVAQQVAQQAEKQAPGSAAPGPATASSGASSGFITVTKATGIEVVAIDPVSSATAAVGSKIRFRVNKNVVVQNVPVFRAGTLLTGTIQKVTKGSKKRHRNGKVTVRMDSLILRSGQNIRFTGSSPSQQLERNLQRKEERKSTTKILLLFPLWAPMLPLLALMAIGMWGEGGKPDGDELVLEPCFRVWVYTSAAITIPLGGLPIRNTSLEEEDTDACPSSWDIRTNPEYDLFLIQ